MAKRTANTNAKNTQTKNTGHSAGFTLTGQLESVYVGKKFAYAKIKVEKPNGFYDRFTVAFDLYTDFPDDGATVNVCGTMTKFLKEMSFTGTVIEECQPF